MYRNASRFSHSCLFILEYNAHFGGSSHLLFNVGGLAGKSTMEVSLKPEYESGIIMYVGARGDGRGDFASLALVNGYVEFRYALQSGIMAYQRFHTL